MFHSSLGLVVRSLSSQSRSLHTLNRLVAPWFISIFIMYLINVFSKIASWLMKFQESLFITRLFFLKVKGGIDASSSFVAYTLTFEKLPFLVRCGLVSSGISKFINNLFIIHTEWMNPDQLDNITHST